MNRLPMYTKITAATLALMLVLPIGVFGQSPPPPSGDAQDNRTRVETRTRIDAQTDSRLRVEQRTRDNGTIVETRTRTQNQEEIDDATSTDGVDARRLDTRTRTIENQDGDVIEQRVQVRTDGDGNADVRHDRQVMLAGDEDDLSERMQARNELREQHESLVRRHKAAREQLTERKELRDEALTRAQEARDAFKEARDAFRARGDEVTDEIRDQVLEKARTFLTRLLNSMLRHLEALEGRVSNAENLNDGVKTQIMAQIAAEKVWVEDAINRVPNLTTVEDIRSLTSDVKDKWRSAFLVTQRLSGRFLASRLEDFLEKLTSASDRVDAKITALNAEGVETSTLAELHGLMETALSNARSSLDRALTLFSSLTGSDNARSTYSEAMSALREAHGQIREAHRILNEIIVEIKRIGRDIGVVDDEVEETDNESTEDTE